MAKAPAARKARTKSSDTPESSNPGGPAIQPAPAGEAPGEIPEGAPPVPADATAPAAAASGADRAESEAGDEGAPPSARAAGGSAEAGKGDEAGAGPVSDSAPADPSVSDPGIEQECLVVVGPARGRRRCGVRFGPEPQAIPIAWLRPDEVAAIEADPMLTVTREMRIVRPL